ncbi:lysophospholipase [Formosa agariphila KMM 3901]|uniref:Lysophospholipase n=1 Tax=Formosa agariphila (strain DSM 15362 / KCTC 12365 / LMG 23005 / KMM 3901 / M-2Alg 35-1) TaxID=1347342 RepID=T2KKX2_FORAG|nr:alpha/beta hydrolase [Formosa agariphila]CDF79086.1 lysophospholipase [Formosa agariphila KMM 3901]
MDLNTNFTTETINLNPDYEGEVIAVLIASKLNTNNRKSVLYIHGYVDYFFHSHYAEQFNANNLDFYALDLRKYGRSLLPHQHPNYCKNLKEYYEEISFAIRKIKISSTGVYLLAHSTGGLTTSCYMNEGKERHHIDGLILNSPFLDFNQSKIEKCASLFASRVISKYANYAKINGVLSPAYAQSIHKDYYGEWDFNLNWKPIKGFPTYFKWVVAIANAQKSLEQSNIQVPVLVMYSSGSLKTSKFSKAAMSNDIVLNNDDIKRVGKTLGSDVSLMKIENAQHDIFLSPKAVRTEAFKRMFSWLSTH